MQSIAYPWSLLFSFLKIIVQIVYVCVLYAFVFTGTLSRVYMWRPEIVDIESLLLLSNIFFFFWGRVSLNLEHAILTRLGG